MVSLGPIVQHIHCGFDLGDICSKLFSASRIASSPTLLWKDQCVFNGRSGCCETYRPRLAAIKVIYNSLDEDVKQADISDVMRALQGVVDESIELHPDPSADGDRLYDISKIDFEKLKREFEQSPKKNTTVQSLIALVPVTLTPQEVITQENVARVTGYDYRTENHVLLQATVYFVDPHLRRAHGKRGEADKIAWLDPQTGYECIVMRDAKNGYLRGFVGLPLSHPLYGFDHDAIPSDLGIEIHGGLTYGKPCDVPATRVIWVKGEVVRVCHQTFRPMTVPGINATDHTPQDDAWWLGFDCNHPGDLIPKNDHNPTVDGVRAVYRDDDYVVNEVLNLASQLSAIELCLPMPDRNGPILPPMGLQPEDRQEKGVRK